MVPLRPTAVTTLHLSDKQMCVCMLRYKLDIIFQLVADSKAIHFIVVEHRHVHMSRVKQRLYTTRTLTPEVITIVETPN